MLLIFFEYSRKWENIYLMSKSNKKNFKQSSFYVGFIVNISNLKVTLL